MTSPFAALVQILLPVVPRPVVARVARRYIAGETRDDALSLAARLRAEGYLTTLDMLGEDVSGWDDVLEATRAYAGLIEAVAASDVPRHVSLKPTHFGLKLDPDRAAGTLADLLAVARRRDVEITIDMEDASTTDATLALWRRVRLTWPRVGLVLQARLHRTEADAGVLAAEGATVRLCKGIYKEPASIAWTGRQAIRDAFVRAARALLAGSGSVQFATHDAVLVDRLRSLVAEAGAGPGRVEFQALLGVPVRSLLEDLRAEGWPVRLYVPYGRDWYAYSLRRLRENPDMASAITLSLLRRDRIGTGT